MEFRNALRASGLPQPRSNRGYDPVVMMESFFVCVWIGGVRFSHTSVVRFDKALRDIFGWKNVASVSTYTRWFRRFNREEVDAVFGSLGRWFWSQLSPRTLTLDLDSSVVQRFGEQEGVVHGYNKQSSRPSHRPLFAFIADWRMVLIAWLRPGNTDDKNGTRDFIEESLALLGDRHRVGLIRADAGFYDGKFVDALEEKKIDYIVSARFTRPLRYKVAEQTQWISVEKDAIEVAEFPYQSVWWKKPRRMVVVRQRIERKPKAFGRLLIEIPGYKFSCFITTLTLAPVEIWRLYNGRCDSENRIAELKGDFGLNGFCLDPFYATEAAFRSVMLAYNLMSLFRQALLQAPTAVRMPTMRFQCFALGAWIGRQGRKKVLRISLEARRRPWFEGLFGKIAAFRCPWPAPA
jgi:hypothetical protein